MPRKKKPPAEAAEPPAGRPAPAGRYFRVGAPALLVAVLAVLIMFLPGRATTRAVVGPPAAPHAPPHPKADPAEPGLGTTVAELLRVVRDGDDESAAQAMAKLLPFADDAPVLAAMFQKGLVDVLVQALRAGPARRDAAPFLLVRFAMVDNYRPLLASAGVPAALLGPLQLGVGEARSAAARTLWELAVHREAAAAIDGPEALPHLVALLHSGDQYGKHSAAGLLRIFAADVSMVRLLVQEGAIGALAENLHGTPDVQLEATGALWSLSENAAVRDDLLSDAVVTSLLSALQFGGEATQELAAGTLRNLATEPAGSRLVAQPSPLAALEAVALVGPPPAAEHALATLWHAAVHREPHGVEALQRSVPAAVRLLGVERPTAVEVAAGALWQLALDQSNVPLLLAGNAVEPLVAVLASGTAHARRQAAGALWFAALTEDGQRRIGAAGAIPHLLGMAVGTPTAIVACGALRNLAMLRENRRLIVNSGGLPPLVNLLRSASSQEAREHVVATLWNVILDPMHAPALVEADAVPALVDVLRGSEAGLYELALGVLNVLVRTRAGRLGALQANAEEVGVQLWRSGWSPAKTLLQALAKDEAAHQWIIAMGAADALT